MSGKYVSNVTHLQAYQCARLRHVSKTWTVWQNQRLSFKTLFLPPQWGI